MKFDCDCRKPKPGMLIKAAKEFNIDLTKSWMVGDSDSDIMAGKNAGCSTVLIGESDENMCASNLLEAVDYIIGRKDYRNGSN